MQGAIALTESVMRGSFVKRYDADGGVWMWVRASTDLTSHTLYEINVNEYGPFARVTTDTDGHYCWMGAPHDAVAEGDSAWLQIGGYMAAAITANIDSHIAGSGIRLHSSLAAPTNADYCGADGEFAVVVTDTEGASTSHTLMLIPERVLKVG